ncbi:unnamed protein product [Mucor circinelloides]
MSTVSQDIILYWFPGSPQCQKIYWILNYKKVDYKALLINRLEPHLLCRPLDGGYRKPPTCKLATITIVTLKVLYLLPKKYFSESS